MTAPTETPTAAAEVSEPLDVRQRRRLGLAYQRAHDNARWHGGDEDDAHEAALVAVSNEVRAAPLAQRGAERGDLRPVLQALQGDGVPDRCADYLNLVVARLTSDAERSQEQGRLAGAARDAADAAGVRAIADWLRAIAARAPSATEAPCAHEWIDARDDAVLEGVYCGKCCQLVPAATEAPRDA